MSYTVIDNHKRASLNEGRNFGMGGAFAKIHKDKKEIELVMPITACGDFYAEVVHTEYTSKEWNVYGFNYKKSEPFDLKKNRAFIVTAILHYNGSSKYNDFDKEVQLMETNYQHIEKLLNWFEDKFGIKNKTKITKLADNRFLFSFDLFWTQGTYKISLYKLLSRMALAYDGIQDPIEYLDKVANADAYIWKPVKPKVLDMISGYIPEQKMTDKDNCPHNLGIQTFKWPRELPKLEAKKA